MISAESFSIEGDLGSFSVDIQQVSSGNGLEEFRLVLSAAEPATPPEFTIVWSVPSVDIYAHWSPRISLNKPSLWTSLETRAARYAPVIAFYDAADSNRMTFACSDGLRLLKLNSYLREEDARIYSRITFFSEETPAIDSYEARILIDRRPVPLVDALAHVTAWWASQAGYEPAHVPDGARRPVYSTWYSYHQNISVEAIVKECRLSRELGLEAVIVDDGWQTLDSNRGYAFTGDWEPVRVGNMGRFVELVHQEGMKFLLWYSVPLVGEKSKNFERFEGKYLWHWESQDAWVLDPRFPEVREFIINTYVEALTEWNLDGFKLDFIGMFRPEDNQIFTKTGGRDFASLDKAVDALMTGIMSRLRQIRPDILIEFRQPYTGPLMRKYGNMFRAADCPNMAMVNRVRTTDIRLLAGGTAVHSDMFVWHTEDSVESAALQILNILFSVPQLSVKLEEIPEDHVEMIRFWINYWNENSGLLLDGYFRPRHPHANYPVISSTLGDRQVVALYADMVAAAGGEGISRVDIVNAKYSRDVVIDLGESERAFSVSIFDTRGRQVKELHDVRPSGGLLRLDVPPAGLARIIKLNQHGR